MFPMAAPTTQPVSELESPKLKTAGERVGSGAENAEEEKYIVNFKKYTLYIHIFILFL